MNNRFDHLKKKNEKKPKSLDEFIEGAEKPKQAKLAKKQKKKEDILLAISGRMNREEDCVKPISLYLKKSINEDIDKYCHGNKQAILNYLIEQGLNELKTKNEPVMVFEYA